MIENLRTNQLKRSCISRRYQNVSLVPEQEDVNNFVMLNNIKDHIVEFVEKGDNLIIQSDIPGNGKTSWACKLGINYIDIYASDRDIKLPVLFVNVPEYLAVKKAGFDSKEKSLYAIAWDDAIKAADLVIWDDIVSAGMSDYDANTLYVPINYRYSDMKANIYTTNCSIDEMSRILGERLSSRIVRVSKIISLVGADCRNRSIEGNLL